MGSLSRFATDLSLQYRESNKARRMRSRNARKAGIPVSDEQTVAKNSQPPWSHPPQDMLELFYEY
jgi:hypothetical protein